MTFINIKWHKINFITKLETNTVCFKKVTISTVFQIHFLTLSKLAAINP